MSGKRCPWPNGIPIRLDQPPADGCAKADGCFLAFSHHLMTCPTWLSGAHLCDLSGRSGASRFLARRSKAAPNAPALPSKEDIVAFIADAKGKVGKREIARAFGVQGGDRLWLKQMLRSLEGEGVVDRRRKGVHKAGQLPPVVLADIAGRDRDGELFGEPAEWDAAEHGPPPKILVTLPRKPRPGAPTPGVGDRVLLRVEKLTDGEGYAYAGRVIKVIGKQKAQALGIFRALPNGGGRIVPVEKKAQGRELLVRPGDEGEAQDGDLVAATTTKDGRYGLPHAKVRERLGSLKSEKAVSLIAIHAHAIPHVFSKDALAEAEAAQPATLADREDWRDAAARHHRSGRRQGPRRRRPRRAGRGPRQPRRLRRHGRHRRRRGLRAAGLGARPRGAGARQLGLLPRPGRADAAGADLQRPLLAARRARTAPALAVRMVVGADGRKKRHSFHRVMMRSAAKLVLRAGAGRHRRPAGRRRPGRSSKPCSSRSGRPMRCVKRARDKREPLALDLPERKILLKPDGDGRPRAACRSASTRTG